MPWGETINALLSFPRKYFYVALEPQVCLFDKTWLKFHEKLKLVKKICEQIQIFINTQQEPQDPWSRISRIVGQFGHWVLESNSSGMASLAPNRCFFTFNLFSGLAASGWTPINPVMKFIEESLLKFLPAYTDLKIILLGYCYTTLNSHPFHCFL